MFFISEIQLMHTIWKCSTPR